MRGLFICVLFFVILLLAIVFGAPVSSDPAADTSDDPSIGSLLPVTPPLGPEISKHDTVILVSPDGMVILVDGKSAKILGSFASGAPIYSSYQALDASAEGENFYIDCGKDWKLYVHENGVRKGPCINVEDILRQTPYVSASGVMLSSKKTTVFLVDADTGKVIRSFRSDNFSSVENQDAEENPIIAKKDFDQYIAYSDTESEAVSKPLYVMRTDYLMKYTSSKTGKILWYLGFADVKASFQCKGIEKFLDGISHENQFGPGNKVDVKLPLDCYRGSNVYLFRDYSSLESLLMSVGLLNSLPGGKLLSLPTPDQANSLQLLEKLSQLHHNNEDREALALPPTETENYGMKSLPGGNGGEMNITVVSDIYTGFQFWPPVLLFAFLLMVGFLFHFYWVAVGKQDKLHKQAGDLKSQALTSRKKKARKAGTKNSSNDEKKQKNVLSDKEVGDTNVLPNRERTERSLQLTFSKGFEGYVHGRRIGKLVISNKEIAKGSNGTIVLEGLYDGRPVAVKRLVQTHHDVALKEIQNLIASDQHQNIVRWYGVEYDQDFIYLSLERCTCNLEELISSYSGACRNQETSGGELHDSLSSCTLKVQYIDPDNKDFKLWKANGYPSPQLLKLMRDMVSGLAHLHELGIVHRDLKPQNVLVIKERSICAKLSDMGISKRLAGNKSALTKHATGYGSSGWQAPEQLRGERQTRAVDLFSLGCVLFFCITGGEHPFGGIWERDGNIIRNHKDLFMIESIPEAKDLISRLLDPDPELRPRAGEILSHPFFWNSETRLSFLRDASDRVELEDRANDSELLEALESVGTSSFGSRWDEKMQSIFINDIGRYRRYKFDSIRDLLRVIRNKLNHYRELSNEIQEILGQVPEGFDDYFSSRFPNLLINVYRVIHRFCAEEDNFRKYFFSNQL